MRSIRKKDKRETPLGLFQGIGGESLSIPSLELSLREERRSGANWRLQGRSANLGEEGSNLGEDKRQGGRMLTNCPHASTHEIERLMVRWNRKRVKPKFAKKG